MIKKYRLLIMILLVSSGVFAQLATIRLYNVRVDNVSIPNGSPIEMGTRTEVNIKCVVQFTKPSNISLTVNSGIKSYNGQQLTTIATDNLPGDGYNVGFTENREFTILARDYPCNGSGYFYAGAQSAQGNIQSVNVFVKRTPTYSITQSQSNITCGSLTNITFTANSSCSSNYNWVYGSGWTFITQGSETITLKPNVLSPGSVELRPTFLGVLQSSVYASVGLAPFTSNASISGNNLCSSNVTYSISPATQTVNSWSLSNSTVATIVSQNSSSVTLSTIGNGQVTLNANVNNSCGQTGVVSKVMNVGAPIFPSGSNIVGPGDVGLNQNIRYSFSGFYPPAGTYWSIDGPFDDSGTLCNWQIVSGQGTGAIMVKTACFNSVAVIRLNWPNGCGTSYKYLYVNANQNVPCISSIQNRRTTSGNYESVIPIPCTGINPNARVSDANISSATLFDMSGTKIKQYNSNDYDVSDVEKGIYILKVESDNQIITTKIIVE